MDEDAIYRRVNLEHLSRAIRTRYPETKNVYAMARQMVVEFNRVVARMVEEFERGEGEFGVAYFTAERMLNDGTDKE